MAVNKIKILEHFNKNEEKADRYVYLSLKDEEVDKFLNKLPGEFRKCYVSDANIKKIKEQFDFSYEEVIQNFYIPVPGNVMSGEFGEILSYFILKEHLLPIETSGPKKWRWKDDKNKPVHKTDVMLFHQNETPSQDDIVIAAEIKAKATKNDKYDPVVNAVDGVKDDYIRRLGVSLTWLNTKYVKDCNVHEVNNLKRFLDPVNYGSFKKEFKAIIVIDSSFLEFEIKRERELKETGTEYEVIFISIKDLKLIYEDTYKSIIRSGCDLE
jgi:hypothetical protein